MELSAKLWKFKVTKKITGGSTGKHVTILKNLDALARERAATWRGYSWAGIEVGAPQARFWGVPLKAIIRFKYRIIDIIANRIRLSAFEVSEEALADYFKRIEKFRPAYLYG